jgi:hypothetical protein
VSDPTTNADRDSESFERNAVANEGTAAAERQTAIAEEGNAREKIESAGRVQRAEAKEARAVRTDNRDERVNQFRRWLVYLGPFAFLAVILAAVFGYTYQAGC